MKSNRSSLDILCVALCEIMGGQLPETTADAVVLLTEYAEKAFDGGCGSNGLAMT